MLSELQYKIICEKIRELLLRKDSELTRIAIPWLHIIREHPVVTKRYEIIFSTKNNLRITIINWVIIFVNILLRIRNWVRIIFIRESIWISRNSIPKKLDCLFISHFINFSNLNEKGDFYFNNMPNELIGRGRSIAVGLINHTNRNILRKEIKEGAINRLFFSKTIGFFNEIKIFKKLRLESKSLKNISVKENDILLKKIALRASKEVLQPSTYNNMLFAYQIEELIKQTMPEVIITTYEGHAFERIAFAAARSVKPDILCISYQHTGVFRLSNGIRQKLHDIYNPNLILTSGQSGKVELEEELNLTGIPKLVLGSSRGVLQSPVLIKNRFNDNTHKCLVLPEGLESEVITLFQFSVSCALLLPNIIFIWRLHPLISFSKLKKKIGFLRNLPKNIILSNSEIEYDISSSSWVLYRGTTAVYKAISEGLRPIYLQLPEEMSIDPLFRLNEWRIVVEDALVMAECIKNDISNNFQDNKKYIHFARKICEDQFAPININVLDDIIEKKIHATTL
jgi:hypothetical protein